MTRLVYVTPDPPEASILNATKQRPLIIATPASAMRPYSGPLHLVPELDCTIFQNLELAGPDDERNGALIIGLSDPDEYEHNPARWGSRISPRSLLVRVLGLVDKAAEAFWPVSVIIVLRTSIDADLPKNREWIAWLANLLRSWNGRTRVRLDLRTILAGSDRAHDAQITKAVEEALAGANEPQKHQASAIEVTDHRFGLVNAT